MGGPTALALVLVHYEDTLTFFNGHFVFEPMNDTLTWAKFYPRMVFWFTLAYIIFTVSGACDGDGVWLRLEESFGGVVSGVGCRVRLCV